MTEALTPSLGTTVVRSEADGLLIKQEEGIGLKLEITTNSCTEDDASSAATIKKTNVYIKHEDKTSIKNNEVSGDMTMMMSVAIKKESQLVQPKIEIKNETCVVSSSKVVTASGDENNVAVVSSLLQSWHINIGPLTTMPKCTLPPMEEYEPVEKFVHSTMLARHSLLYNNQSQATSSSSSDAQQQKVMRGYRAIVECLRRRDDPQMLHKVLCALRTSGGGGRGADDAGNNSMTLNLLSYSSTKNALLLHFIFRLDPFVPVEKRGIMVKGVNMKGSKTATTSSKEVEKFRPYYDYTLADAHLHLMVALVSANSVFLSPAMNALWKLCTFQLNDAPIERVTRVHAALSTILRLCPKGKSDIYQVIASNFPFKTTSTQQQIWYAKQCLIVLQYVPTIHGQILELLIDKCLEIDVEIKIEDGGEVSLEEKEGESDDDDDEDLGEGGGIIFDLDMGDDEEGGHGQERETMKVEQPVLDEAAKIDEMADKLDSLMLIAFQHLTASAKSSQLAVRQLYRMVSPVFDSSVLTTHRSKFVQFIILLLCGFDSDAASDDGVDLSLSQPKLYREFSAKLIDIVLDPYRATVTRQSSACYLASFVSRATYVCAETVCESISALLRWAEAYMATVGKNPTAFRGDKRDQCEMHSLFYTVCQAAFYVMCFRGLDAMRYYRSAVRYYAAHGSIEEMDGEASYADPENVDISPERWARICSHPLQPLRYCLESVRGEFLHLADVFGLLPPSLLAQLIVDDRKMASGMQKKRRASAIKTAATLEKKRIKGGVGGLGRGSNPLDSFFPFDPYLLRRSHPFIEPYYRNWNGGVDVDDALIRDDEIGGAMHDESRRSESLDGGESEDDRSESDSEDADHQHHMPESTGAPGMSYKSTGTIMGESYPETDLLLMKKKDECGASMSPKDVSLKTEAQRDAWAEELRRTRSQSIGGGSW